VTRKVVTDGPGPLAASGHSSGKHLVQGRGARIDQGGQRAQRFLRRNGPACRASRRRGHLTRHRRRGRPPRRNALEIDGDPRCPEADMSRSRPPHRAITSGSRPHSARIAAASSGRSSATTPAARARRCLASSSLSSRGRGAGRPRTGWGWRGGVDWQGCGRGRRDRGLPRPRSMVQRTASVSRSRTIAVEPLAGHARRVVVGRGGQDRRVVAVRGAAASRAGCVNGSWRAGGVSPLSASRP